MQRGQAAIAGTLILAFVLGAVATVAIRRTTRRRSALADDVAARFPPIPQSRLVAPWAPALDADQAHATFCLDDADTAADGASRFTGALTAAGWKIQAGRLDPTGTAIGVELGGWGYRLRGMIGPGTRPDCVGANRQMALTVEVAR